MFKETLLTVVGQAYEAAGYALEDKPVQQAGGRFRFVKRLESGQHAFIEYQFLAYVDTEWSSGMPSRFRVTLIRSDTANPNASNALRRDLSALVVEDFGVAILPSAAHWWAFRTESELGQALAEAGKLVIGYGIPWLAGELDPPV